MSMNLIAMLVSLAMMLTGAGGAVQTEALPVAQTARTLTLSNVSVTWNGETTQLEPQVHMGVSTDGQKAVYDFAVDLGDKKLFPVQVSAGENGLTALSGNSGVAVNVTAGALAGLAEQLEAQMNASLAENGGGNARLMQFITEEYMPAYTGLIKLAMDPERREGINTSAQAVFDRVVDRGEGTAAKLEVDNQQYDVTAYSYSLDAMQMAALSDEIFKELPELADYYNALFKLYDMMPEESGLCGLDSYAALFERFGIQMQMDVEEQRTEDGKVDVMDGVLTMDLSNMMAMAQSGMAQAAVEPEAPVDGSAPMKDDAPAAGVDGTSGAANPAPMVMGESESLVVDEPAAEEQAVEEPEAAQAAPEEKPSELPVLPPIVMKTHSVKIPDYSESTAECSYALDERHGIEVSMLVTDNAGVQEIEGTAYVSEDGARIQGCKVSAFLAKDAMEATNYTVNMTAVQQDTAMVDASFYGVEKPDGTSENSANIDLRTRAVNAGVSFDLNVTDEPIEDVASAAKADCVIDDLSEAGQQNLTKDSALLGALMQAAGSMTADFNQLKADPGVNTLWSLIRGEGMPIDVNMLEEATFDVDEDLGGEPEGDGEDFQLSLGDDADGDYQLVMNEDGDYELVIDGEGGESPFDYDEEPVEDDGVLAFAEPRMNWLPEGWQVTATETDTAYDWVQLSIVDAKGAEIAYAIFFQDPEAGTANYIVQSDGKVLDGRMMNVTDFGEGGLSVTVSENGMYGNLMFTSEAIELDTIGQIVAGIEF